MSETHRLLDQLADGIAAAASDAGALAVAARVVQDLERLAGGELGAPDTDAGVVGRRFARAHRLLLGTAGASSLVEELSRQLGILDDPFGALLAAWHASDELRIPEATRPRCSA